MKHEHNYNHHYIKFYILILCYTRNGTSNLMLQKEFYSMTIFSLCCTLQIHLHKSNFTLQIFSFPAQHTPSNDTASSPHQSDSSKVKLPSQVFGSFSHQHKALGIGHYLRGIQCLRNNNRHLNDLSISFV